MSPSVAAFMATAISAGPPNSSRRQRTPSRWSKFTPTLGAVVSHSSWFRHARVMVKAVMLPAMAAPGSPSIPAVITARGSISLKASRMQVELSKLRGAGSGTNPDRKILANVSSFRHPIGWLFLRWLCWGH